MRALFMFQVLIPVKAGVMPAKGQDFNHD